MATVLIIEDVPHVGPRLAGPLARRGHRVMRCAGGLTPYAACPMMRGDSCSLADAADVIVFACTAAVPFFGRTYRAEHLLAAYCGHDRYGRIPMLLVGPPSSELVRVGRRARIAFDEAPEAFVDELERLLDAPEQPRRQVAGRLPRRRRQLEHFVQAARPRRP